MNFFTYFGCTLRQDGNVLIVALSPQLAQHFGKPTLRLVFQSDHVGKDTELVTCGSYITNRIHDLLKDTGEKASITLPKRQKAEGRRQKAEEDRLPAEILPYHSSIKKRLSREIHKTEVFITFRVAYYSNAKFEELVTTGIDIEDNVLVDSVKFPYTSDSLKDATVSHFPFTRKQAKEIYDKCLRRVSIDAEEKALTYREKLSKHYHRDVTRLEGYYQQMVDEIPELAEDRSGLIRQLQHEYELKVAEELKKCHVQVSIEPMSFCTVNVPFRRYRYILERNKKNGAKPRTTVDVLHNLFSGTLLYPRCESCGREMKEIEICDLKSHPVCRECAIECHECGSYVCRDCGIEECAECGRWVCHQCSKRCHLCGKDYCAEHLLGCLKCREHFCRQCTGQCEECGKLAGNIHVTVCDISHKYVCLDCIIVCSCCAQKVGQSLINSCAFCGQHTCSECTFSCNICGKAFCVHHITECEISGKMVCPHHSGVCEKCSRHTSTVYQHTCDICGKKLCTQCSVQCNGCGVFFCEEHTAEMARCLECGNLYCSLCYSGQIACSACRSRR